MAISDLLLLSRFKKSVVLSIPKVQKNKVARVFLFHSSDESKRCWCPWHELQGRRSALISGLKIISYPLQSSIAIGIERTFTWEISKNEVFLVWI